MRVFRYILLPLILLCLAGCGRNNNATLTLVVHPASNESAKESIVLSPAKSEQTRTVNLTVRRALGNKPTTRTASLGLHFTGSTGASNTRKYFIKHSGGQQYALMGGISSNVICTGPTEDYDFLVEDAANRISRDIDFIVDMNTDSK